MNERGEHPTIYAIRHRVTGRVYIGASINPRSRWVWHQRRLSLGRHHCAPLQAAWDADGPAAFEHVVLETFEHWRALHVTETLWLRHYSAIQRPYNVILNAETLLGIERKAAEHAVERVRHRPKAGYPKGRPRTPRP